MALSIRQAPFRKSARCYSRDRNAEADDGDPAFDEILEKKTASLLEGWKEAADKAGVPLICHQSGSMFGIFFSEKEVLNYPDACEANASQFKAWFLSMLDQHIYLAPSPFETLFMSYAHSDEDIEKTIKAAKAAMEAAAKA